MIERFEYLLTKKMRLDVSREEEKLLDISLLFSSFRFPITVSFVCWFFLFYFFLLKPFFCFRQKCPFFFLTTLLPEQG
jgi:hypothetical protein